MLVLALHGVMFYVLSQQQVAPVPSEARMVFVNLIGPPAQEQKPAPPLPRPRLPDRPRAAPLAVQAPAVSPTERVVPPEQPRIQAAPEPPPAPAPMPAPMPAGPAELRTELSVNCPDRPAPTYPARSIRSGEEGRSVLRVELDEAGRVSAARVLETSGFQRLDEAALAAVKTWRCDPVLRDGQPVRAIALQPFKFVIQGR